ncbi:MAG: GTP-binding protein [Burkholderiaceae bacterium]|nr:GTP-binding protein [Burkholderiaceae bacterium]
MRLRPRVRLHVLTGFLGSGKSTLLRRYLHGPRDASRVAVLINEFGKVAIDHVLVSAVSPHSQAIAGGCACCNVDDALRQALVEILAAGERDLQNAVTDIVLETSGMADPSRIIGTIRADINLAEYLDVTNCITTVEAGSDIDVLDRFPEARNQIACANRIVLTKGDLCSAEDTARTAAHLKRMNPLAPVTLAHEFDLALSVESLQSELGSEAIPAPVSHSPTLETFQVGIEPGMTWPKFSVWLTAVMHRHGSSILRFKGVIPLGRPDRALVLQSVRHRVSAPEHLALTTEHEDPFGLVFICDGSLELRVRRSLAAFSSVGRSTSVRSTRSMG